MLQHRRSSAARFSTAIHDGGWRLSLHRSLRARTETLAATMHRLYREPGDARGDSRALLPQLLAGRCVSSRGHRARGWGGAVGWHCNCVLCNRRFSSGINAKAAQYAARDDSRRLPAPRRRDGRGQGGEELKLRVPIHTLEGLVCWGQVSCSPPVLGLCCERGVGISFLYRAGSVSCACDWACLRQCAVAETTVSYG